MGLIIHVHRGRGEEGSPLGLFLFHLLPQKISEKLILFYLITVAKQPGFFTFFFHFPPPPPCTRIVHIIVLFYVCEFYCSTLWYYNILHSLYIRVL